MKLTSPWFIFTSTSSSSDSARNPWAPNLGVCDSAATFAFYLPALPWAAAR